MPKILVRMATIFAPSWRKRCSTKPDISGDAWTVFFKSNSDALNSAKILVFRQQVIPSESPHNQSRQILASVDRADSWNGTPLPGLQALRDIYPRRVPPIHSQPVFVAGCAEILSHRADRAPAISFSRGFYP